MGTGGWRGTEPPQHVRSPPGRQAGRGAALDGAPRLWSRLTEAISLVLMQLCLGLLSQRPLDRWSSFPWMAS